MILLFSKGLEILQSCSKGKILDLVEALEINRIKNTTPNTFDEINTLPSPSNLF